MRSLEEKDVPHWLVWQEGWKEWRPVAEVDEFMVNEESQVAPPPVAEDEPFSFDEASQANLSVVDFGDIAEEEIDVGLAEESSVEEMTDTSFDSKILNAGEEEGNLREFKRFDKKFKVRIENEIGQVFETFTKDISAGGAQLVAPLPTWVVGYCSLKLTKIDTGESVELTCSLVEDQNPRLRYRIAISPMSRPKQDSFERWLAA